MGAKPQKKGVEWTIRKTKVGALVQNDAIVREVRTKSLEKRKLSQKVSGPGASSRRETKGS